MKTFVGATMMCILGFTAPALAQAEIDHVNTFTRAFQDAQPGDDIILAPGIYIVDGSLTTPRAGTAEQPITVRGSRDGESIIRFIRSDGGYVEGFRVQHARWVFESLTIEGQCEDHSQCEHAWHLIGDADYTVIRHNIARDFNAQIKANRQPGDEPAQFADDVIVSGNEFYNTTVRETNHPVTPIDVVGGRRWVVRDNFIHDHAKNGGNGISYAAFLKGNSQDGLFEGNLIACEFLHRGQIRLGLSFGGGGSQPDSICESGTCSPEHQNGMMINNIIIHCSADVGIFIRECQECQVLHNTLFNTAGIDFIEGSTGTARYNLLMGRIQGRDRSMTQREGNLAERSLDEFRQWFEAPDEADFTLLEPEAPFLNGAAPLDEVIDDYCDQARDTPRDIGALEYIEDSPCDTRRPMRAHMESTDSPDMGTIDPADGGHVAPADGGVMTGSDAGPVEDAGRPVPDAMSPVDAIALDGAHAREMTQAPVDRANDDAMTRAGKGSQSTGCATATDQGGLACCCSQSF